MWNSELLSSESVKITSDAYLQWLQMKYDFYTNTIWFVFIVLVWVLVFYVLTWSR